MINYNKESLFILIKSLSKSEKRQFKLFVGRVGSNLDSKFLKLFNLLDKMSNYDEKYILNKKIVSKRQLSNLKAHLYKQLLVSLKLNPLNQNLRSKIRQELEFASILYNKGLYKQSLKILDKAKSLALKSEDKFIAFEIVELEKLIESQYITRSLSNRSEKLISESNKLIQQNNITSRLSNLSLELYEKLIKAGYAKSDKEFKEITKFFFERMPDLDYDSFGFREKLWHNKAYLWFSLLIQDFLSSYKYAMKWVDMFNDNPEMIKVHPVFYLQGNNYLLESLMLIKHPDKFRKVLDNLTVNIKKSSFPKNDNLDALYFLYYFNNKINLYFLEGEFKQGTQIVESIISKIDLYKDRIDQHHIMVFYYKIACLYFGSEEYEKTIFYLNMIIKNKSLKMREDLLCFTRVLNLVAHYEAGFDFHLDKILKETYKFLLKMNDLHSVQKSMIKFIRSLGNIYPHELRKNFKKLYKEIKAFEEDPYERRSFLYLDIISWLESKIYDKPIELIIKEKAKHLNKKVKHSISHL